MDLTGKLLIAMPGIGDPRFEHSVIFLCSHSEDAIRFGGPVEVQRGFVLH